MLTSFTSCRDLGIVLDSRLSSESTLIRSGQSPFGCYSSQILCFLSHDPFILIKASNVFVTPLVEYRSPVWSPTAIGSITKIELVQRWSTLSNLTYDERLFKLGNERLGLCRPRADLLTCYRNTSQFC